MADKPLVYMPLRKLRKWRKYRELSQGELADKAGLTTGFISQLENDQVDYSGQTLKGITEALNCTPDNLMFDDPPAIDSEMRSVMRGLSDEQREQMIALMRTMNRR